MAELYKLPEGSSSQAPKDDEPRWELVRVVRAGISKLKWGLRLLLFGGAILVLAQVASVYRLLADVHPWVGIGGAVVFAGLVVWFVGRPLLSLVRVPLAVKPPVFPEEQDRSCKDCRAHLRYLDRYLLMLHNNPELTGTIEPIDAARSTLSRIQSRCEHIHDVVLTSTLISDFEREHLEPLLAPLDRRADALIRKEALAIGSMTALSPNGTADAFIVLWRNINLIAALGRLYYGRPGLHGTYLLVRDVSSAILLSSVLEQLTDMGGSVVRKMGEGGRTLPLVGALVGPLLDGTINGLMTMKVGYLAKERCRSFQAWDRRTTRGVLRRTFDLVADSSTLLVEELQKGLGTTFDRVKASADAGKEAITEVSHKTVDLLRGLRRAVKPGNARES